ncbi:MAG: flagellar hook-associated protein FlgK, partial [Betaproteobacteria bacterium]|nr:flagellar hook-associated protein FlgK [Betaproteobacteria bacterium]
PLGDNRNGLLLTQYGTAPIIDGQSPAENFASLVATIGSQTRSSQNDVDAFGRIRDDAIATEQSVSGVNLDEEAARLLQFQQAYQASAKIIATAEKVFDAILGLGR